MWFDSDKEGMLHERNCHEQVQKQLTRITELKAVTVDGDAVGGMEVKAELMEELTIGFGDLLSFRNADELVMQASL